MQAILCVDDEALILNCLKEQLRRRLGGNFLFETANSGEEALEVIAELVEDEISLVVVVSDGLRGDEFLVQVHEKYPKIVTIMLTGQANQSAIDRAITEANLYRCLHKPWNEEELVQTIQAGLANLA
jgi:DNA-binding NtrC family response regulator